MQTILVAEEDADIRFVLVTTLEGPGFTILEARNGFDALRLVAENAVDLLVADLDIPLMNGYELARKAKLLRPALHVIYLSGSRVDPQRNQAPLGRALLKPFSPTELAGHVANALRKSV